MRFFDALEQRRSEIACFEATWSTITASNESLDLLLRRSSADLSSMIRYTPEGALMMAGIPWFTTLFGRDSILTVLLVLPFNPALAQSTLRTFAALQGAKTAPHRDEQPGKIGLTSKISK